MTTSNSKRRFLRDTSAGVLIISFDRFIPPVYAMDPFITAALVGGVISTVVQGVLSFFQTRDAARINAEAATKAWHLERVNFYLGQLPAQEQMALLSDRQFVNQVLSSNVDSYGTILRVSQGRVNVERGGYSGTITADQARIAGGVVMGQRDSAPVPVTPEQRFESARDTDEFIEYQADNMKIPTAEYRERFTPRSFRKFSNAHRPSKDNADLVMVTAVNNGKWLDERKTVVKTSPQIMVA